MTCVACETAKTKYPHGVYISSCRGCTARALCHTPDYFESYKAQRHTKDYVGLLMKFFGKKQEEWLEGHQEVRSWSETIMKLKDKEAA